MDFHSFIQAVQPNYVADDYHAILIDALQAVGLGSGSLLIAAPPGSGKSQLVSILFPAWLLAHDPSTQIIGLSSGDALAAIASRAVKSILLSPQYTAHFGEVALDKDTQGEWMLKGYDRPSYSAVG